MDHVFVESREEGWFWEVSDSEGKPTEKREGKGVLAASENAKLPTEGKHVFVVWQAERFKGVQFGSRAVVDLYQVAWPLVAVGAVKDRKLETLAEWCSVPHSDKSPADHARVVRECYFRLIERLRIGLKVEDVGRTLASGLADKAFQMFGKLAT